VGSKGRIAFRASHYSPRDIEARNKEREEKKIDRNMRARYLEANTRGCRFLAICIRRPYNMPFDFIEPDVKMPEGRAKLAARHGKASSGTELRVSGTSPLSFDVPVGATLTVREFGPSHYSRPTVGSGFKSKGFLLFHNQTKVGRLSPDSLYRLGRNVPPCCTASEIDKERKILRVVFKTAPKSLRGAVRSNKKA
jgi:hypothetical protein